MTKRVIHVGIGGFGRRWCKEFLGNNIADGKVEVVAIVDTDPEAVKLGQQLLGLPDSACFTDIDEAFSKTEADFCTVVVPPEFHEAVIDVAITHGVDVLCEKPIADTMAGSVRIARGRQIRGTTNHDRHR